MKIHEYQGKELFRKFGVPVPEGIVCKSAEEVQAAASKFGGVVVVKSQIHAGGRGKGKVYSKANRDELVLDGGVKVVKSPEEAKEVAQKILGNILVTHQTGAEGREVKTILLEQGCDIKQELYLGLVLDRATSRVTIMASTEGGMDIEEVAANQPEKILKVAIDPAVGFQSYQGRELGFGLGFSKEVVSEFVRFCNSLYTVYMLTDASIVEINPLVLTGNGKLLALDAKVNFDENAMFRHKDLLEFRDLDEEDPQEIEASKYDLSYVKLDGNIGCMVNGAGLAMATMDIIKLSGKEPANFLDVGGGANKEKVTAAFKIILNDPNVKGILVNIFGGIMRCDVIAEGVVAAAKEMGLDLPLVVRLQGTNVNEGKKILEESGLKIIPADTMQDAADAIVKAIG
ncbi:MAG: ADP-forming succinate--CoA ligase subunit beta [Deltaproteobacteria bacterium]|nr:ADP-forming succinate--CoA ligase subunit beta [Deltaproteobacteria bacterium]